MPIDSGNLALKGLDDLFSTEENRQEEQREQVQQIPIDALHPFTNHPFKVLDDEAMTRTVESIAQYGVLAPLIARPRPDGDGYEIISGHRRQYAAKLAGLDTLPVIVRQMSDDAAVILMVDSNLQREHILPSERALAYKMKLDAMRRTSGRPSKENPRQLVGNFETADVVGKESGESGRQVQRFIRLTNLIPELLDMVDEKKIAFNPAVELSYLDESQQRDFLEAMEDTQNAPSLVVKPSEIQQDMVQALSERAAEVHSGSVDPSVDNMLKITSDGRKIGLDQRLMNSALPDDPNSKLNACVNNVLRIWNDTKEQKLTQLIFCDMSTPKGDGSFNVYRHIPVP